jgi:hypothetical protein
MSTIPRMVRQITVRPPITPPTIGPTFTGSGLEEAGFGSAVEDMDEEVKVGLELDAGIELDADMEDASATVAIVREAGLFKDMLGMEEELDGVVVAFAAFGVGKYLTVRASAPQAMYSKD